MDLRAAAPSSVVSGPRAWRRDRLRLDAVRLPLPAFADAQRREWDSNPRGPVDQRLSRAPLFSRSAIPPSSPAWARTRTLLIQSQTCCQLHHGARYCLFARLSTPDGRVEGRATGRTRTDDPVITSDVLYQLSYGGDGAEGSRTPDLSVANAALSQLSYGPDPDRPARRRGQNGRDRTRTCDLHDVNVAL